MAGQKLWKYAEECARRDGLCFVHERSDGPPVFALMTIERYEALAGSEAGEEAPIHAAEAEEVHATPEMVGFVAECEMY
jgi:hypothetical protein